MSSMQSSLENRIRATKGGYTLIIAIFVAGIVLAIGAAILNLTVREFILTGIARESVIALSAADAGLECAHYWDRSPFAGGSFDVGAPARHDRLP